MVLILMVKVLTTNYNWFVMFDGDSGNRGLGITNVSIVF
jgi:hypothetical protein